ncbi:MAG: galactokinase [Oligoflexia bacterium]|nr:galactokinase [Oligoflexia bacterium]
MININNISSAYGRVNLIGEHTDYNGGLVFPTLIPEKTTVQLTLSPSHSHSSSYLVSANSNNDTISYLLGEEKNCSHWSDYLKGVTKILREENFNIFGYNININIESNLPMGSGLSSSAALIVALFRAMVNAFHLNLSDIDIAKLGQRVENEFVGARVGIMDPMVISVAQNPGQALFIDTKSLCYQTIDIPDSLEILVINSGISHSNRSGGYLKRREECEEAAKILNTTYLSDLNLQNLSEYKRLLFSQQSTTSSNAETLFKRVRHVLSENDRVLKLKDAFINLAASSSSLNLIKDLFASSHLSMKNDYEVSIPEIDRLVELVSSEPHIHGARLTGGGFGGSVVALVEKGYKEIAYKNILSKQQQL